MKNNRFTAISLIFILVLLCMSLASCGEANNSEIPIDEGAFKLPQATGETVLGNDIAKMDVSNSSEGYVLIKYNGECDKTKLQIKHDSDVYTYDLTETDKYMVFPFSCGDGTYNLEVYENILDNQYALVGAATTDVKLVDDTSPFLYPNNYVNYNADSKVVPLSYQVTANSENQLQLVEDVYTYVVKNIDYDYETAENLQDGYIPDLDQVIDTKKGICFDYASLMSAMLRIRNIPTKLVVGYSGDVYHAWISVYISDVGWVQNAIEFDGTDWTLMDPTFAASSQRGSEADYVKNQDQYHALYFY